MGTETVRSAVILGAGVPHWYATILSPVYELWMILYVLWYVTVQGGWEVGRAER